MVERRGEKEKGKEGWQRGGRESERKERVRNFVPIVKIH